jgi:non-canonical purine NTP pyrophosphatase (RdgB/HAM1 family)
VKLLMLEDVGLSAFDVEETGDTLEANAIIKARAYANASGIAALGDDTGLEVDALGGRPGVYSARYGSSDRERCEKLLGELASVAEEARTARFACVIAVVLAQEESPLIAVRGVVEGRIAYAMGGGSEGFGYDSVFIPEGYNITWSALPLIDKNRISHRGEAAKKLIPLLKNLAQFK